ncbi:unnamed protein product [Heterobilharzia americana]|nr:unnamed protein product [Heterobilharzia americana]
MVEIDDGRHFKNAYEDYSPINHLKVESTNIPDKLMELLGVLNSKIEKLSSSDISIYTGLSGIGLFYHFLSQSKSELLSRRIYEDAVLYSEKLVQRCLRHTDVKKLPKNISVFTGPIGALCLGGLFAARCGTDNSGAKKYLEQILSASSYALDLNCAMPDEALYGRTGYLNCLLTLKQFNFDIPPSIVSSVIDAILESGQRTANIYKSNGYYKSLMYHSSKRNLPMPPLMFEWHEKCYLGGAHGFSGILTTLLKAHYLFPGIISANSLNQLILPTVEWMGELQLPSGNWPSSLGDSLSRDVLVHWCHGATGVIPFMLSAYKFAEWCTDCFTNATRVADRPYSLFEGLAGTLYFLVGILDPMNSKFPLLSGI